MGEHKLFLSYLHPLLCILLLGGLKVGLGGCLGDSDSDSLTLEIRVGQKQKLLRLSIAVHQEGGED